MNMGIVMSSHTHHTHTHTLAVMSPAGVGATTRTTNSMRCDITRPYTHTHIHRQYAW